MINTSNLFKTNSPSDAFKKSLAGTNVVSGNLTKSKVQGPVVQPTQTKPTAVTSAPSATNTTTPALNTPPRNPALQTPAANSFLQTQLADAKKQAEGISAGIKNLTPTTPEKPKDSAYIQYLKTMFNPDEAKLAMEEKNAAAKNLSDINQEILKQSTETRRNYEGTINQAGGLKDGTQAGASSERRRANSELADLSLRQLGAVGASEFATDLVKQYMDAGASIEEAELAASEESKKVLTLEEATTLGVPYGTTVGEARLKGIIPQTVGEGFSLSEGQARYDAQGNLIAQRGKTYAPGTGSGGSGYVAGENPIVDSWVNLIKSGQSKITSVPANLKNAVAEALSVGGGEQSETSTKASSLVDELLSRETKGITGLLQQYTGGLAGQDAYTKNLYNQLKGLLSLEKRTLLKGSGAISDYEFKVLEQAASSLGRNLEDEDFRTVLAKLKVDLGGGGGQSSTPQATTNSGTTSSGVGYTIIPD